MGAGRVDNKLDRIQAAVVPKEHFVSTKQLLEMFVRSGPEQHIMSKYGGQILLNQ